MQVFCRERANLSVQLKDTKTVVGRLESVVGLILHIVAIFLYLIIFDVSFLPSYDVVSKLRAWCRCASTCLSVRTVNLIQAVWRHIQLDRTLRACCVAALLACSWFVVKAALEIAYKGKTQD